MFRVLIRHLAEHPQSRLADIWKATYPEKNKTQVYKALETLVRKGFLVKEDIYYSVAKELPVKDPYSPERRNIRPILLSKELTSRANLEYAAKLFALKDLSIESLKAWQAADILFNSLTATLAYHIKSNSLHKLPWLEEFNEYVNRELALKSLRDNQEQTGSDSANNSEEHELL